VLTSKIDQGLVKVVELQNFVKEIIFLGRISYSYRENPDTGISTLKSLNPSKGSSNGKPQALRQA